MNSIGNLCDIQLFSGLSREQIDRYIDTHKISFKAYKAGSYVFMQADRADRIYVLISGRIIVFQDFYTGQRHKVTEFSSFGDMFAEVYAFLKVKSMDYSAYADEASVIMELPAALITKGEYSDVDLKVMKNFIDILAGKAYFLNKKLQIITAKSIRSRLATLILSGAGMKDRWICDMTRESMAEYLNVARPSLSRELMKMKSEGLIDVRGSRITILNRESLNELI